MRGNYLTVTKISGYAARRLINRGETRHRQHHSAAEQPEIQIFQNGKEVQDETVFGRFAVKVVITIFLTSKNN